MPEDLKDSIKTTICGLFCITGILFELFRMDNSGVILIGWSLIWYNQIRIHRLERIAVIKDE